MKLHERTMYVSRCGSELESEVLQWLERCDLTWAEAAKILHGIAGMPLKYILREERHPDNPEKKADEA